VALTAQNNQGPRLKKEKSYTYRHPLCLTACYDMYFHVLSPNGNRKKQRILALYWFPYIRVCPPLITLDAKWHYSTWQLVVLITHCLVQKQPAKWLPLYPPASSWVPRTSHQHTSGNYIFLVTIFKCNAGKVVIQPTDVHHSCCSLHIKVLKALWANGTWLVTTIR